MAAYNLIVSKLNKKDFDIEIYNNFYTNICEEEEENNRLFALIHFLLNSEKYSDIKSNYKIDTSYIAYYYMDIYNV